MHLFTSHRDDALRYFANFYLPTHPVCWLRGHRAKAEVMTPTYVEEWILVTCRTCGVRHQDPYLTRNMRLSEEKAERWLASQIDAAKTNNADYASVRDGRENYGHREVHLSAEIVKNRWYGPGLRLHIGDRWSETPLDGSLHLLKRAVYFSVGGVGNRLAERIILAMLPDRKHR